MAWYNRIFGGDTPKQKKRKAYRRSYTGASTGRLFADFLTTSTSADAEIKDNYTFTLSVEPIVNGEPMIVGRENIEISVLGEPDDGPLGLGLSQGQIESGVYLIVAILFAGIMYRAGKPTIDQMVESGRNRNRAKYAEKLIASREQGFSSSSEFSVNPPWPWPFSRSN